MGKLHRPVACKTPAAPNLHRQNRQPARRRVDAGAIYPAPTDCTSVDRPGPCDDDSGAAPLPGRCRSSGSNRSVCQRGHGRAEWHRLGTVCSAVGNVQGRGDRPHILGKQNHVDRTTLSGAQRSPQKLKAAKSPRGLPARRHGCPRQQNISRPRVGLEHRPGLQAETTESPERNAAGRDLQRGRHDRRCHSDRAAGRYRAGRGTRGIRNLPRESERAGGGRCTGDRAASGIQLQAGS